METGMPVDAFGRPMVWVSISAKELVNLGNYNNVTIGPATVGTWVPQDFGGFTDVQKNGMTRALTEMVKLCEQVVAGERALVMQSVKP